MEKETFKKALKLIKKYDCIIIHRHTHPDGDAIGSQVGLKYIIKDNFPEKRVYIVGDDPGSYSFIEGSVVDDVEDDLFSSSLCILLDSSSPDLISDTRWKNAKETLRFDHHIFSEKFCSFEVIDESAESACGLITAFSRVCKLKLSKISASALYTGMVTDSGRFLYDSVNSNTLSNASFLLSQDVDIQSVYNHLYKSSFESVKVKGDFISRIKRDGNVCYIYNSKEDVIRNGGDAHYLSRAMVNVMSGIEGVDVWANFTESDEGILCEFRSDEKDVQGVAISIGGGGHKKASGAVIKSREEVKKVLEELKK